MSVERLEKLVALLQHSLDENEVPAEQIEKFVWFITQSRAYLDGEYKTIDEALSLEENPGE